MQFRGGMAELMRQASRMQRRLDQRRSELKDETFEASTGEDKVKVTVNGVPEVVRVSIDPSLLTQEDLAMVEDLVAAAVNAALTKSREMVDAELQKISGGVRIPGMT